MSETARKRRMDALAGGLAGGTTVAGVLLFMLTNPYIAFSVFLAGLVYWATIFVATKPLAAGPHGQGRRMSAVGPLTVTFLICPVCGRSDRFTPFTGKSHFVAGARCPGVPVTVVYRRVDSDDRATG